MFSKIKLRVGVILFILFSLHIISFAQAQQQNGASPQSISSLAIGNTPKYSPDRIIVKFKSHITSDDIALGRLSKIEERNAKFGVYEVKQLFKSVRKNKLDTLKKAIGLTRIYILKVPQSTDIEQMVAEYGQDTDIEYAEPDYIVEAAAIPNDTYFNAYQWNLHNTGQTGGKIDADIDVPEAWDITTGNSNVVIAIVDTGVQLDHLDLSNKIVPGYDFVNSDNDPSDDNGHGTHVAGIAAASSNNSTGVAGVCWDCLIMPVKVLDNTGSGYVSNVASGITYATDNGAKVINLSLGSSGYSTTLYNAVLYAYNAGRVIVAGTGNDGIETVYYPAGHKEVIAVGATNSYDVRTSWSNYGAKIDVVAPGENIISSYPYSAYAWASGTSMATPHVAGLAGLILSHNPTYNTDQVRWHIELAADDQVGNSSEDIAGWDKYHGWGRINAYNALQPLFSGLTFSMESVYSDSYSKGVNPSSGTISTTFTYKVIYIDDYTRAPSFVQVCIDGNCYNMGLDTFASSTLRDGNYANGEQYIYVTNLLAGSHNCYFITSNGIDTKILPKVGTLSGPTVIDNTPPTGSITINSGAAYINSLYVTLTLSCIDTGSGCAQMQFSNDNTNWSTPEAYANSKAWTLASGNGTKTVYAKFKDNAANWSGSYSDTIILDTIAPTTTASPPGGTYASAQSVTLTCNDGTGSGCDKIYYTTDGSTPTTTSPVYSVPTNISTTTTLKFFATDLAGNQEAMKTEIYTIDTSPPIQQIYTIQPGPTEGKDTYYGTVYGKNGVPDSETLSIGGWGDWYYDFFEFDLTGSPSADDTILVMLYLYGSAPSGGNDPGFQVYRITESWTETGVNLTNNPASIFYKNFGPFTVGTDTWNKVDITDLYKDWKKGIYPNYGIKLVPTNNNHSNGEIASSDNVNSAIRPKIEIVYNAAISQYTLTVSKSGIGSGTITSSDGLINCGSDCTETYNSGTSVTLTAVANSGYTFSSWTNCDSPSSNICIMTMNADKTVTSTFTSTPVTHTLSVASSNPNSGVNIAVSPNDNNGQGSGTTPFTRIYNNSTSVTLTAPSTTEGNNFSSWSGCDSTSGTTCYITMNADKTVTANFVWTNGEIPISTIPYNQTFPSIAYDYNNQRYLVVWQDNRSGSNADVYGQLVNADGSLYGIDFAIAQSPYDEWYPAVAFDGTNYLVAWRKYIAGTEWYVHGARVSPTGVVLDPSDIIISSASQTALHYTKPAIAFDGTNHLVVWQDTRNYSTTGHDIYGARVSTSGSVLDPSGIPISTANNGQINPAIAYDGTNYLIVWSDYREGNNTYRIYGARVNSSGAVIDSNGIVIYNVDQWALDPAIAFDGTNYFVTWWYHAVKGTRVTPSGVVLDPSGITISSFASQDSDPSVAFGDGTYFVGWTDNRSGTYDIYGTYVKVDGTVATPNGNIISAAANNQWSLKIVSDDLNKRFLMVWHDYRNGTTNSDIYGQLMIIDTLPPSGSIIINSGATYTNSTSVTLTLTCDDGGGSSCTQMQFSNDNITYSTPETFATTKAWNLTSGDGTKTVYAKFKDNAGNWTGFYSDTITLDTIAPTTTASPPGGTYASAQSVTLTCNDGTGSGCDKIYYTTDGSTPTTSSPVYSSPINISTTTTPLKFFAMDLAGNSESVKTEVYTIDITPPTGSITINSGTASTNSTLVNLTLSCTDTSGCSQMCISNTTSCSSWESYATSKLWTLTSGDGTKTVYVWFKDGAGNANTTPYSDTIILDTTSPTTTASPPGGTYSSSQSVTLTCNDGTGSGCDKIYYTSDGSTPTISSSVYTSPINISITTTLKFFAVDLAGNQEDVKTEVYIISPLSLIQPNGGEVIPSGSTFTIQWNAPPEAVKFDLKYSLNNGATWVTIANNVTGNSYNWKVPKPLANKKGCFVKVIGYNASGIKVGEDTSDSTFTIEVIRLTSPNGGETLRSGSIHAITWTTNATRRPVARVRLFYTVNGGTTWTLIKTLTGNPGSYNWRVPNVSSSSCKVKVVLKDASGNKVGSDVSDNYFTIQP